jgi:hypothetical protein
VIPTGPIAAAVSEGLTLLKDASQTGALVMTLPETLPVSEALELCIGLRKHDIPLSKVCVNRVPFDPFTDAEREAVRTVLEGRAPMLGERSMERIDRARVALARLSRDVTVPVVALQDVWLEGTRLVEELATSMKGRAA